MFSWKVEDMGLHAFRLKIVQNPDLPPSGLASIPNSFSLYTGEQLRYAAEGQKPSPKSISLGIKNCSANRKKSGST
ncbi:hypothetical protein Y1Q_0009697 [Alligator mississippiensis]|uniref:Uncharacterized protein n=1 Tax=Alligator mississippiensis TaxID=8496 RepID=A0A151MWM6_ALLMI|nr:hypothetical protein Y1Q_0009697 [Alligator mississippiensis]